MTTYEKITASRVPLQHPFEHFYILILPMNNPPDDKNDYRDFYLHCENYGTVVYMFGCSVESDDDAIEMAYTNGPEYIDAWREITIL